MMSRFPILPWWRAGQLFLAVLLLAVAGCDSVLGTDSDARIEGTWETQVGERTIYLEVGESTVTIYQGRIGECFRILVYDRIGREGDTYTLEERDSGVHRRFVMRVEGERLRAQTVEVGDDFDHFMEASTADVSSLEECSVLGTWVTVFDLTVPVTEYLDITETRITVYNAREGECFVRFAFDIVDRFQDTFTLQPTEGDGGTIQLTLRNEGAGLEVSNPDTPNTQSVYTDATGVDLTTLDVCLGPDDESIDCSALPAIAIGQAIDGRLDTDDAVTVDGNNRFFYDLYGLTLDAAITVRIDLSSNTFDPYLGLYDAGGAFLEGNDDVGDTNVDSSLTLDLAPGCYRIEASSSLERRTGVYTLRVTSGG